MYSMQDGSCGLQYVNIKWVVWAGGLGKNLAKRENIVCKMDDIVVRFVIYLRLENLLLCPPMACVEDHDVGILPLWSAVTDLINFEGTFHFFWRILWGSPLWNKEWVSVILNRGIVVYKFEHQLALVLRYGLSISFVDPLLIRNPLSQHTQHRLPIVPS